jgi:hypothetical protein
MGHPLLEKVLEELNRVARKGLIVGIRLERPMKPVEFLLLGALGVMQIPLTYIKKVWLGKSAKVQKAQSSKIEDDYVLHREDEILSLFSRIKMETSKAILVNTRFSLAQKILKPYFIYYLSPRK